MSVLCPYPFENENVLCRNILKSDDNFCSRCGNRIDKNIFKGNFETCFGRLEDGSWCMQLMDRSQDKKCPKCGTDALETVAGCSMEKQNYLRIFFLILEVGTLVLQRVLNFTIRKGNFESFKSLLEVRLHLAIPLYKWKDKCKCNERLHRQRDGILSISQWDSLYVEDKVHKCGYVGKNVDCDKMDISLLSIILLHFFHSGEDIKSNLKELVSRIRSARNDIFHMSVPKISISSYGNRWDTLKNAICTLAYLTSENDNEYQEICNMIVDIEYGGIPIQKHLEDIKDNELARKTLREEKFNTKERIQRTIRMQIDISARNLNGNAVSSDELDSLKRKIVKGLRERNAHRKCSINREADGTCETETTIEIYDISENVIKVIEEYGGDVIDIEFDCIQLYIAFGSAENFQDFRMHAADRIKSLIATDNLLFYEQLISLEVRISLNEGDVQRCQIIFSDKSRVLNTQGAKVTHVGQTFPDDDPDGNKPASGPSSVLQEADKSSFLNAQDAKVTHVSQTFPDDDPDSNQPASGPFSVLKEAHKTVLRNRGIQDLRIGVFGKGGVGKSALCSCLAQKPLFKSQCSGESVTKKSEFAIMKTKDGRAVYIYDTPGELGRDIIKAKVIDFILECVITSQPGFNCIIVAISIGREPDDVSVVKDMETLFETERFYENTIVVFTKSDLLDEGQTFEEYKKTLSVDLKLFIEKCGNRVLLFNNKLKGIEYRKQCDDILHAAISLMEKNNRTIELSHFENTYSIVTEELKRLQTSVDEVDEMKARKMLFEGPTEALRHAVEADIKSQERFFKYLGDTLEAKEL